MIPRAFITHWRSRAPWALDEQVEQDLVISRAIVEIFSDVELGEALAFRGGTALHKVIPSAQEGTRPLRLRGHARPAR